MAEDNNNDPKASDIFEEFINSLDKDKLKKSVADEDEFLRNVFIHLAIVNTTHHETIGVICAILYELEDKALRQKYTSELANLGNKFLQISHNIDFALSILRELDNSNGKDT